MLLLAGLLVCTVPASAREKQRQLSNDNISSARHPQSGDNNIQNYQTLRCYQAGQEIINVSGLTNLPSPIYIGMRGVFLHKRQMAHCSRCFLKVPMCCAALIKCPQIKLMAENTTCPICGAYIDYLGNGDKVAASTAPTTPTKNKHRGIRKSGDLLGYFPYLHGRD